MSDKFPQLDLTKTYNLKKPTEQAKMMLEIMDEVRAPEHIRYIDDVKVFQAACLAYEMRLQFGADVFIAFKNCWDYLVDHELDRFSEKTYNKLIPE